MNHKTGDILNIPFENRNFDAIVIDPTGRENGKPSLGIQITSVQKYTCIPQKTLERWENTATKTIDGFQYLNAPSGTTLDDLIQTRHSLSPTVFKVPSGKEFDIWTIDCGKLGTIKSIEVIDLTEMVGDILMHPGRVKLETQHNMIRFLMWFAAKGLYASAYAQMFGQYTKQDDDNLTQELNIARGIIADQEKKIEQLYESAEGMLKVFENLESQAIQAEVPIFWKNGADMTNVGKLKRYVEGKAKELPKWS